MSTLPKVIGLCPVHAEEFYVPHGGICPEPGCDREMAMYVSAPGWYEAEALRERLGLLDGGEVRSLEAVRNQRGA
jgi:hypothetical protein